MEKKRSFFMSHLKCNFVNFAKILQLFRLQIRNASNYKEMENNITALKTVNLSSLSDREKKKAALLINNLGHSKYMQVDFDEAIKDYTKAIELDGSLSAAYYNRGTIHYRMGCYEEAYNDFQKAVHLDSTNEEFISGLKACEKSLQSTKS